MHDTQPSVVNKMPHAPLSLLPPQPLPLSMPILLGYIYIYAKDENIIGTNSPSPIGKDYNFRKFSRFATPFSSNLTSALSHVITRSFSVPFTESIIILGTRGVASAEKRSMKCDIIGITGHIYMLYLFPR